MHAGHCIKAHLQHLPGWSTFHTTAGEHETICTRYVDATMTTCYPHSKIPNPSSHFGCKTFEPILGAGRCGNQVGS
jgi:hypothetical protein